MSSPAGIGIQNADGTIQFIVIADRGWIKDGIGDILNKRYITREKAEELVLNRIIPEGFSLLLGSWPSTAVNTGTYLRKLVFWSRCVISYAYLWTDSEWTFRIIDGSASISLRDAIQQGIED